MALRAGDTGTQGGNNAPDDGSMEEFDNLVAGMGGDDEGSNPSVPATQSTNGQRVPPPQQTGNQGQQRPPAPPSGNGQPVPSQQGQAVDPQVALHRLNQYETTLIPQLQRRLQEAETKATQLQQTEQGVRQYTELMTQYGLKPDEAQIGLQMAAAYRRNPAEFLKSLINTTRANNVDLSTLGVQAGLDPNALNLVLDNKLKPIIDWFNNNRQQEEAQTQAERDIQEFFTQYPDAHVQQSEIAVLMQHMNLDNVNAYYQLKMWAMQNQYDWNQPLTPQINARKAGAQQQQGNGNGFPATRRSNSYNQPVAQQDNEQFDVNANWKDIMRQAVSSVG